jgi:hypothetical protein
LASPGKKGAIFEVFEKQDVPKHYAQNANSEHDGHALVPESDDDGSAAGDDIF